MTTVADINDFRYTTKRPAFPEGDGVQEVERRKLLDTPLMRLMWKDPEIVIWHGEYDRIHGTKTRDYIISVTHPETNHRHLDWKSNHVHVYPGKDGRPKYHYKGRYHDYDLTLPSKLQEDSFGPWEQPQDIERAGKQKIIESDYDTYAYLVHLLYTGPIQSDTSMIDRWPETKDWLMARDKVSFDTGNEKKRKADQMIAETTLKNIAESEKRNKEEMARQKRDQQLVRPDEGSSEKVKFGIGIKPKPKPKLLNNKPFMSGW